MLQPMFINGIVLRTWGAHPSDLIGTGDKASRGWGWPLSDCAEAIAWGYFHHSPVRFHDTML